MPLHTGDLWLYELYKVALTVLGTAVIGQFIVAAWQMRNKRRELEIAAAGQLQHLYGEFKDIWRLWKIFRRQPPLFPEHARYDLLRRATAAEAKVEALVMKLAVERALDEDDIRTIGLFKQGFQQLRQHIRDEQDMHFNYKHPEYRLFNDLAAKLGAIILSDPPRRPPPGGVAARQLERIALVRKEQWAAALGAYAPYDLSASASASTHPPASPPAAPLPG